ncbi:VOC family protein [Tuwongella immobilis]|uniref:VOC domain-containing protein n=1 Tax=Tuwongella immobilis TaxID=692036 RepID=A0A6C2YL17_9BACT|nr:VOC family protein [Tuwongella immobilis]VIP01612.1 Glyoxalase domain-cantaining protein OS=Janthinobacterium sp. HH01 GN=Jab_1c14310 PE=4 SV=1: Glyoxalase_2 [Tuwongella immobilis]VTR98925.1 Glyoxalase domain-cantaining protein OS=Janthinobacterium sp. HH01 GN=Jab_1c14310 PE=4 SV=1: Glyoxalase_2 [Tuwongella immobilis]
MGRVKHFEIHVSNPEAAIAFYSKLLGWKFTKMEQMPYWMIETGPREEPGIDGGMLERPCPKPELNPALNAFVCTAEVSNLDDTMNEAVAMGAIVALPKMPIPGTGYVGYIIDPDGNTVGLFQPDHTVTMG